jgi:hypothetical protein
MEAGPCGPIEPLFEPVVAPEHFAVRGDETRRADDADLRRAGAFGLEPRLVGGALGPLERCRRIDAACGQQCAKRRAIADRQALAEFGKKNSARVSATRAASRLGCGKGSGRLSGTPMAPHVRSRSRHM